MTSNALVAVGDLEKMAQAVSASKLFGTTTPEQALALMLVAQAEGLHPATAARDYHIVQGRPTLKADAMLSRHMASGGSVEWHEYSDAKVAATFSHPKGGSVKIDWDFARAKQAGLGSKDMWLKYPRQMLRARVISEGIKTVNPGVATGFYTPEEAQDFEPAPRKKSDKAKDMGAAEIVPEAPTQPIAESGEDRMALLTEAAAKTTFSVTKILETWQVSHPDELDAESWASELATLRKRAKK